MAIGASRLSAATLMWILSPLTWLTLAIAASVPAWFVRARWRWLWCCCAVFAAFALLMMTPLVANALLARLERPEPAEAACRSNAPEVVVVLAGGIDQLPTGASDFSALGVASRRRLDSALSYWRAAPGRLLVITGGPARPGVAAESRLLAAYAASFGVPESALRLETRATNTWQNAHFVSQLVPAVPHRIALATSALHMPRAILAFRSAGFEVCPIRADPRFTPNDLPDALVPRSSALLKTEAALHEFVGLIYYRLRALREAPG